MCVLCCNCFPFSKASYECLVLPLLMFQFRILCVSYIPTVPVPVQHVICALYCHCSCSGAACYMCLILPLLLLQCSMLYVSYIATISVPVRRVMRVLCWILTDPDKLDKRAIHVKETWATHCDKTLYMSSQQNDTFSYNR